MHKTQPISVCQGGRSGDGHAQGLLDAAAAEKILGQKLPEGTPGQPSNGAKRSLDPADPNGSGEEEDLDTTLDALLHEHKKAKLEAQL